MKTTTKFKVGDRVRTKGAPTYPGGIEFTVDRVVDSGHSCYVTGDPKRYGVWAQFLELVEPETAPPVDEYNNPTAEAAIRATEDLQAVLRRRNEQIVELQAKGGRLNTLRALQADIGQANAEKGFREEGDWIRGLAGSYEPDEALLRNYYTARLALITTEVAEAIEELRNGRAVDETWYANPPLSAEKIRSVADDLRAGRATPPKPLKPEGVPSELADVVIRSFDFAHEAGFDLAQIIEEKLAYNATRPAMHGRKF